MPIVELKGVEVGADSCSGSGAAVPCSKMSRPRDGRLCAEMLGSMQAASR